MRDFSFSEIGTYVENSDFFRETINQIKSSKSPSIKHLSGSLKASLVASIFKNIKKSICVLVSSNSIIDDYETDLLLMDKFNLITFPEPTKSNVKQTLNANIDDLSILDSLSKITENENHIIIANYKIFEKILPQKEALHRNKITLKVGDTVNYEEFRRDLIFGGFEKCEYVSHQGQISTRGGIIDIFPVGWINPIRIESWGDEIESIREFDILSQRSINNLEKAEFTKDILTIFEEDKNSEFLSHLPPETLLIIDSPDKIKAIDENWNAPEYNNKLIINPIENATINIKSTSQPAVNSSMKELVRILRYYASLNYNIFLASDGGNSSWRLHDLIENTLTLKESDYQSGKALSIDNINNSFAELEDAKLADPDYTYNILKWMNLSPVEGFICDDIKTVFFTEHQIFNRIKTKFISKKIAKKAGISLKELKQLQPGDFVVHTDKGIGKFEGIESINLGGSIQDCVRLTYEGGDTLYVHLNYINKIQKYSASEGTIPKLSKLGSSEWERKKARTKKRLKDIARDLIKIYAKRKAIPGYSFPTDTIWQKEFEASFMYEDTPDQHRAGVEVKNDMESNSPMDRLVCGDVGFGKTEVAIRAAFKAAQNGKQTAVLVPTTILAQQHYESFNDRMKGYPINIGVISRFRTKKEQNEILENLINGKCDILIGTHRLLSKDIKFKDLGLLIIDEEHRFGVSAKEKLRELRANIDTLTLTATPIPRTLNFSLMGARDLSLIETPPRNRLPIETQVIEWDEKKLSEAIHNELNRNGQIFIVNDKVKDIELLAKKIQNIAPLSKIGIAHGQLPASQLEKEMQRFIERKYDILISTKIVESGLDIPNANTIIINKAQNFGLAELYQLRGRVGRSNKQAYCYLCIPSFKIMNNNILKRLEAIEEFTDLGSGFKLAMKDMEIRGAGNLLGAEQSGFIVDIGYELFHKVLDEAVQELRNEEFGDIFDKKYNKKISALENDNIAIEINSDALIPAEYIESETERFKYYKVLYELKNAEEYKKIVAELVDRFGNLPAKVKELLFVVRLRIAALGTGFVKISIHRDYFVAEFPDAEAKDFYSTAYLEISDIVQEYEEAKIYQEGKRLLLKMPFTSRNEIIELFFKIKQSVENLFND